MATRQSSTSDRLKKAAKRQAEQNARAESNGDDDVEPVDPASAGDEPIFELSLGPGKRPFIVIDEHRYHYRRLIEFGGLEHEEFQRVTREYDKLWEQGREKKLRRSDQNRKDELLNWLYEHVLVAEDAAKLRERAGDMLTAVAMREVVLAFTSASSLPSETAAAARQAAGWAALLEQARTEVAEDEDEDQEPERSSSADES